MQAPEGPKFYVPFRSENVPGGTVATGPPPSLVLIARGAGDPSDAIAALRSETSALDPEIAIPSVVMVETALGNTIAAPRFNMVLLAAFALLHGVSPRDPLTFVGVVALLMLVAFGADFRRALSAPPWRPSTLQNPRV